VDTWEAPRCPSWCTQHETPDAGWDNDGRGDEDSAKWCETTVVISEEDGIYIRMSRWAGVSDGKRMVEEPRWQLFGLSDRNGLGVIPDVQRCMDTAQQMAASS
jgi:hypothetical protein